MRAVPQEIRQGSLALGATVWQTTWRQTLPSAIPGIATGTILGLSRAIGEAAPLVVLGVAGSVGFVPDRTDQPVHGSADPDLHLSSAVAGGVPRRRVGGHHPPAGDDAQPQRDRDLHPQQVPANLVGVTPVAVHPATATTRPRRTTGEVSTLRRRARRGCAGPAGAAAGPGHGGAPAQRLLRRLPRRARRDAAVRAQRDHGADRPVRLRQVDGPALPQPHERPRRQRSS